jgi:hypothetical protein
LTYLADIAYPAAKSLLQSRCSYKSGINRLLDECQTQFPSPLWDELAQRDYSREYQRFERWWPKRSARGYPPESIEVLFIALEDFPLGCTLRGSSKWSRDPEDWQWWFDDDYFGPYYRSEIMAVALGRAEHHDQLASSRKTGRRRKGGASCSEEVVEMFFSLGLFGLLTRNLIRSVPAADLLGRRANRWFVLGHPDALYGIILGKQTRTRWESFRD